MSENAGVTSYSIAFGVHLEALVDSGGNKLIYCRTPFTTYLMTLVAVVMAAFFGNMKHSQGVQLEATVQP